MDRCRRAKHFDSYAPGPVPTLALLESGWWFECANCCTRVELGREDDDGQPAEEPCVTGEEVFCGLTCRAARIAYSRKRQAAQNALVELVTTRFPAAQVLRVHVYADHLEKVEPHEPLRSSATFRLPGLTYPVSYHFGISSAFVSTADVDAFMALYAGAGGGA